MIIILIIMMTIIIYNYYNYNEPYKEKKYIDKEIPSYETIQYITIPNKTVEKNCNEYNEFNETNKTFYSEPKFLYPYDSCVSQCMQGIWFGQNHESDYKRGDIECCKKSCETVKNRQ